MQPGRRIRTLATTTVMVVIAAALSLGGPASPAAAYDEDLIVQLANEARWADGQTGLIHNPALDTVAYDWAQQMGASGALSHNPDVGAQIPGGWNAWGENVAQGYGSGQAVHDGWMNSSGHRANILGGYTDIGVALVDVNGTSWGVQVFARYSGHVGPAAPVPAPVEQEQAPEAVPAPIAPAPVETPAVATPSPSPAPSPTSTATSKSTPVAKKSTTNIASGSDAGSQATDAGLPLPIAVLMLIVSLVVIVLTGWFVLTGRRGNSAKDWPARGRRRSLER